MRKTRRLVVVGGVAAGMSAASQVRRRQPSTEVVLFERGGSISYGACGMPYNIADAARTIDDLVVLTPEQARSERGIDLHLEHQVTSLNLDAEDAEGGTLLVRDLATDSEREEAFDALILATGASALRPKLPGMDLDGVSVLRTLGDGARIKSLLEQSPKTAAIIGAGYIGLEMAHVLSERGLGVTLLEKMPQIAPGWGEATIGVIAKELEDRGVQVRTATTVEALEGDDQKHVRAVITEDGRLEADLVIVAAGVRPNVTLASRAGLRIGDSGAIWVDQYQQTSQGGVWAAGDCAESYNRVLRRNAWMPLGTTANKQGRIAGANAAGQKIRFAGVVGTAGFVVFDLEVARTGLGLDQAIEEGFEAVAVTIRQRSRAHGFPGGSPLTVTMIADGPTGLALGCEIVGREGAALRANVLAAALASHMTVADIQNLDLVYAPPFAPVWDPVLVAANQLSKKVGRKK